MLNRKKRRSPSSPLPTEEAAAPLTLQSRQRCCVHTAGIKSALIAGVIEAVLLPGTLKSNEASANGQIC